MLKSLRTKNFRKMEDNYLEFASGMVVIRGENEAGKTTVLEAIGYALFGIKACRGTLADVVTWGKVDTSLSVELVVACDGTDYTITRSKAGAEINYEGGKVTGQNECSTFVEKLFGVSNGNASKLCIGSQGDIRGALSQGPKATMELIEKLANFELLDTIIETVQANLVTGPTAAADAVLTAADLRLQLARAEVVEADNDPVLWENEALKFEAKAEGLKAEAETIKPKLDKAETEFKLATQQSLTANRIVTEIATIKQSVKERENSVDSLTTLVQFAPDTEVVNVAEKTLKDIENVEARLKEYNKMTALMAAYPEEFWEGSEESLDDEETKTFLNVGKLNETIVSLNNDIRLFESQKITGSVCGFCNQDVSKFPEVAKKNDELSLKIKSADVEIEKLRTELISEQDSLKALQGIQASQMKYLPMGSDNVQVHELQVPASLSWIGEVPDANNAANLAEASLNLADLRMKVTQAKAAESKLGMLKDLKLADEAKVLNLESALSELTLYASFSWLEKTFNELNVKWSNLCEAESDARFQADSIRVAIQQEFEAVEESLIRVADAELDVEIAKKSVDDLMFNNTLVKRLRAARPIIADKLWNVVLGAVSSYFSQMRGVVSVVSKESDGFKVDGHSVEGLSGSTLDILGLSIRLALTRTFLPNAPFLVLDEPSAACSDGRTQQMTGFLMAFGFAQTLIVTHKDVDEGAANQLITI